MHRPHPCAIIAIASLATTAACLETPLFGPSNGRVGGAGAETTTGSGGSSSQATVGNGGANAQTSSATGNNGMIGTNCQWGDSSCASGLYCKAPGCGSGTCQALGDAQQQKGWLEPVCGCDNINYFNDTVAHSDGASIAYDGRCEPQDAIDCDPNSKPCPADTRCHLQVDLLSCFGGSPANANCWALPQQCDPSGTKGVNCYTSECLDQCQLIRTETRWYTATWCN